MKAAFYTPVRKGSSFRVLARRCRAIAAAALFVWASNSTTLAGDASPATVAAPQATSPASGKSPQGGGAPIEAQFYIDAIGDSLGVLAGEGLTQAYADNSAI